MLQLKNESIFAASMGVFNDPGGVESAYGVTKAVFDIRAGRLLPAAEAAPIQPVDQFSGDPTKSSLASTGEITLSKPYTDIVLCGSAYAPQGAAKEMLVSLRVGEFEKSIRVFGDRVWKEGVFGCKPSDPETFETLPLVFERAFGGTDTQPRDPDQIDFVARNPIGAGLVPKNSRTRPTEIRLPNLESDQQLIRSTSDRPEPACFAPIAPHWDPRKTFAGTYDETWQTSRAPYLPIDFDSRFFNCTSPQLSGQQILSGGQTIDAIGVTREGSLTIELPEIEVIHAYDFNGQVHSYPAAMDTIVIRPDQKQVTILWRSCQPVDKNLLQLKSLANICPQYPKLKAA
ncbi:DUF2169 domain-containing protein [Stieleria sp. TO1_6]|uniref:DUF2169 family type VI secretion system accessory protein n=1 Tax=Stieleria tagensis TaxID=2956795 RepID=UPI00209A6635|nr:DUF2169 domain-containing protein [Stieleria tagensis]MCO8121108.1 DUF2169 domain-containing protein [Stieleria tagensis]